MNKKTKEILENIEKVKFDDYSVEQSKEDEKFPFLNLILYYKRKEVSTIDLDEMITGVLNNNIWFEDCRWNLPE